jgi:hypothetical protein
MKLKILSESSFQLLLRKLSSNSIVLTSFYRDINHYSNLFLYRLLPTELSTELSPSLSNLDQISSSKFENTYGKKSPGDESIREKRGFFINKNQLVVSSTLTTYAFVSTTVIATVNLINPPPAAQCVAAPATTSAPPTTTTMGRKRRQATTPARTARQVVQCVACLPSGFIVCPASG